MNMMCTRCKERVAIIFMTKYENGQPVNEGYCLTCAKELGIPQVKEIIDKMGISDEDIELFQNQLIDAMGPEGGENGFEVGGARAFPPGLQNLRTQTPVANPPQRSEPNVPPPSGEEGERGEP
jgi:hypothetical protein